MDQKNRHLEQVRKQQAAAHRLDVPTPDRLLRLPAVLGQTGLSRSSLYARIARGQFPAPIPLGDDGRAVAWLESAVQAWIAGRIAAAEHMTA